MSNNEFEAEYKKLVAEYSNKHIDLIIKTTPVD